jgi:hypothetical protein
MDDIIEVARVMRPRSCAKTLAGTCKEMLGTAQSVGCTIDHQHPQAVMAKVRNEVDLLIKSKLCFCWIQNVLRLLVGSGGQLAYRCVGCGCSNGVEVEGAGH